MRGRPFTFANGSGGINKRDAPYLLDDNEARDARNFQGRLRGARRKRDGAVGFSVPPVALTGLFAAQAPMFLIGSGGTKVYSISTAGVVTEIASGLAAGALWEWVQAPTSGGQGPIYGMDGVEALQWTGAGAAAAWTVSAGTLPIGRYLEYAGNRVWVAHIESGPVLTDPGSYVAFSDIGDPRLFPAANIVGFDPNDGEVITGIGRAGDYVIVTKPSKLWVIYDLDTGANRRVTEGVGCVAHRSIVETQDGTYFLSRDQGVFRTSGGRPERLPDQIQPEFDQLNPVGRHQAAAAYFDGHYYLSISQSDDPPPTPPPNDILLDYDTNLGSWWMHTLPAAQLAVWEIAGEPQLHAAVPAVARTDRLFVPGRTLDAGDSIFTAYWQGPHHTFKAPDNQKRARTLYVEGKGEAAVSIAKDFAASPTFVASAVLSAAPEVNVQHFPLSGVARAWSVQFEIASDQALEIDSYTFMVNPRRD